MQPGAIGPGGDGGRKGFDTQGTDVGERRRAGGVKFTALPPGSRVAIIGGGSCGIYTCKTLLEAGLRPTVFEQSHGVGGVWRQTGRGGVAYDVLRTNSSDLITTAPGFPMQPHASPFPHHSEIQHYIRLYAEHFKLLPHIRFLTEVVSVSPGGPGPAAPSGSCPRWLLRVRRLEDDSQLVDQAAYRTRPVPGSEETLEFAAVYLCTGQYGGGSQWPDLPGRERFQGTITHSRSYRSSAPYKGKHVVVVGLGNSALDLALDTSTVAQSVLVSVRRASTMVLAVDDRSGRPQDIALHTRYNLYGPQGGKGTGIAALASGASKREMAKDTYFDNGDPFEVQREMIKAGMPPPLPGGGAQLGQVKDRRSVLQRLREGRIRFGKGIREVRERSVVMADGAEYPCDAILCCTGYDLFASLNFVDPEVMRPIKRHSPSGRQWLDLYKMILHPTYHNLVFCGMITTDANEALVGELQARWATAVLRGRVPWPAADEVQQFCRRRAERLQKVDPAYTRFVRYVHYMDDLARDIGCLPQLPPLPGKWERGAAAVETPADPDERYAFNLWFGPATPTHWRLDGPDRWADPEARRYVVEKLIPGVKTPPPAVPVSWAPPEPRL